jgi:hypothetical protein
LRDFVHHPRKARIDLAAYAAYLSLPLYFGPYEWMVPIEAVAVVDLTVPGSPRTAADMAGDFDGRTITYLFTAARARTATTLLLFAEPQRVPPLRLLAALDPQIRLPFGFRSSRSRAGAVVDGVLLRVDAPREAADRLVAAGALRGVYRDGGWHVDRGESARLRPRRDPPWARRAVDRCDAASHLIGAGAVLGAATVPVTGASGLVGAGVAVVVAVACRLAAGALHRRDPAPYRPVATRPPARPRPPQPPRPVRPTTRRRPPRGAPGVRPGPARRHPADPGTLSHT